MSLKIATLSFRKNKKLPLVLQDERAECGHACVAMISQYWGLALDLYDIRTTRQTSGKGVTLLDINQLFIQLGFQTRALRVPLSELKFIKCPAILHWDLNHFVVLKSVKKNQVVIHDPEAGIRHCSMDEVSQSFTGVVLEVEKTGDFKEIQESYKLSLYQIVKTIHGVNKYVILLLLISLSLEILTLLNPLFMQYVTDDVVGFNERGNLYVIAIIFLLISFIYAFTEYIRSQMVIFFTNHLTLQFSSNVMQHLLKLPLSFFEHRHKGDLQSKFQSIDQIQKKISTDFINTVLDGLMIVINGTVMMIYSPLLTFLVMGALFIFLSIRYLSYQSLKVHTETSVRQHAKAMSIFLETLQSIVPIKSFLKEHMRFNTWRNSYIDGLNADIRIAKMSVIYRVLNQWILHIEHILVVCVGATLVLANQFSLGMLLAFLSYRLLLVNKTSSLIMTLFDYKLISIQLSRLSDILFQHPEEIGGGYHQRSPIQGAISLHAVSFRYHQNEPYIFQKRSLNIKAGEKVVIIGPSGCGKTTLLKVMMGLLTMTEGDLFVDNIPLKEFGLKHYRELTASVMQDDALLSGSIIDNIAFFDDHIDFERVLQSATLACIHDDIMKLPMGYETLIGEMGSILSGGQKQRVLLARALYKKPKLLFLDEATSHLDVDNEKKINVSLKALEITQIVIAHRQETIQMADRIIDLKGVE